MNWAVFRFVLWLVMVGAGGAAAAISKVEPTWTFLGTIVTLTGFVGAYLETPASAKRQLDQLRTRVADLTAKLGKTSGPGGSALAIVCIVGALALVGGNVGCKGGSVLPELTQIEQTVLDDIAAGKTRQQIEVDVGEIIAGKIGGDVAIILDDALSFLIDAGVIPKGILPAARAMHAEEHRLASAHRAALGEPAADHGCAADGGAQ